MPSEMTRDHGHAAARWYSYVFFGYVPPALLAGSPGALSQITARSVTGVLSTSTRVPVAVTNALAMYGAG